ncbi:GNAT family N-acetyltransferase [Streptomyces sp. NPDC046866]|uniref:GNAT family N-acetyltransferase n=1 Tax=Streptomyces sp. NPDC046866 TaxID=3154921 RepID=UPI003454B331
MSLPPQVVHLDAPDAPGGLTLRRFEAEADLPEFLRVLEESLEHLRPWMPWAAEHTPAAARRFLADRPARWASGEAYTYAIVLDGAIVGSCGLYRHEDTPADGIEIGYWLHPAATGRGVATRAARALAEEALRLPGVDHVEIVHDPANRASGAVPDRLGFTERPRRPAGAGELRVWRLCRPSSGSGGRSAG